MYKISWILLSLTLCKMSALADPVAKDSSSESLRHHFGAFEGPMGIRGILDSSSEDSLKPPLYRFMVHAYGRIVDGELLMGESGACPVITVRFPLPLKLKPDFVYTFIGKDAGEDEQIFLVGGNVNGPKVDSARGAAKYKNAPPCDGANSGSGHDSGLRADRAIYLRGSPCALGRN